jgi:phosphatidylglycerol:prolipoprotein diacylglycerol transferase
VYPILFHIPTPWGTVPVFSYGTLIALGFLLTYFYICRLATKRGIDDEHITDLYLVIILTSIVGARGNYVVTHWSEYADNLSSIPKIWEGGMVYLGGFTGAMIGGLGYLKLRGLSIGAYYDMFAPAVPFACGLGRIGCFLNGCCFGVACSLPWAMQFPMRTGATPEPRHPTQIYELIMLLAISAFLHRVYMKNRRPGLAMVVFLYLYSIERFLIEFIREEHNYEHYVFGLTLAQSTCLATAAVGAICHALILARIPPGQTPAEIEAELAAKPKDAGPKPEA